MSSTTQPIPYRAQQHPSSSASHSIANTPNLLTPASTPPTNANVPQPLSHNQHASSSFFESRLAQLLSSCEAGTHSFPRDEMDWFQGAQEQPKEVVGQRKFSFTNGEVLPPRQGSFLSSLSLSRPFSFMPATPTPDIASSHDIISSGSAPAPSQLPDAARPKSTPPQDVHRTVSAKSAPLAPVAMQMQRSKTSPQTVFGTMAKEEKRHFDPGREPKLFGLL